MVLVFILYVFIVKNIYIDNFIIDKIYRIMYFVEKNVDDVLFLVWYFNIVIYFVKDDV